MKLNERLDDIGTAETDAAAPALYSEAWWASLTTEELHEYVARGFNGGDRRGIEQGPDHRPVVPADDSGAGVVAPQRLQQRRREDDVADQAQPHEQDLQSSIVASSISMTGMSSLIGSKGADQGTRSTSTAFEKAKPGCGPPSSAYTRPR